MRELYSPHHSVRVSKLAKPDKFKFGRIFIKYGIQYIETFQDMTAQIGGTKAHVHQSIKYWKSTDLKKKIKEENKANVNLIVNEPEAFSP